MVRAEREKGRERERKGEREREREKGREAFISTCQKIHVLIRLNKCSPLSCSFAKEGLMDYVWLLTQN